MLAGVFALSLLCLCYVTTNVTTNVTTLSKRMSFCPPRFFTQVTRHSLDTKRNAPRTLAFSPNKWEVHFPNMGKVKIT